MARITAKLNLNKTPQLVDNNSLVYAKNIMLLQDNTIAPDTGFDVVNQLTMSNNVEPKYIGQIVGLNNKVYIFKQNGNEPSVGIYVYNEITKLMTKLRCNWHYSGGKIDGVVTINNKGEEILTICEYFDSDVNIKVPIKHINVNTCTSTDDETIYTQTPSIPFTNLHLAGYYPYTIPLGVYQFFVRYKIKEDFYTDWFPASGELYSYVQETTTTIQGQLNHVDTNKDSSRSFVFEVEHLFNNYISNFIGFQIGFILSHDDSVVARSWKTFDFTSVLTNTTINFTYDKNDIQEIDIDDLLKTSYELFNVKNVAYFKNKLYISNFEETDFNPNITVAKPIIKLRIKGLNAPSNISIGGKEIDNTNHKWGGNPISSLVTNKEYVDVNFSTDTQNSLNIPIVSLFANYKKGITVPNAHRQSGLYYIYKGESKSTHNGYNVIPNFSYSPIYQSSTDQTLMTLANLEETRLIGFRVSDKNVHSLNTLPDFRHKWYWSYNANYDKGNGDDDFWIAYNSVIYNERARDQWSETLLNNVKNNYPSTIITKVVVNGYTIFGENINLNANGINYKGQIVKYNDVATEDEIKEAVVSIIKSNINGVNSNGTFTINGTAIASISVDYLTATYKSEEDLDGSDSTYRNDEIKIIGYTTKHTRSLDISIKDTVLDYTGIDVSGIRTLMPFTKYEFYIHFIKNNGIVTNGYLLDTVSYDAYTTRHEPVIIYPSIEFASDPVPAGYVGYFITIAKVGNTVCRGFNYWHDDRYHYIDCLEGDTRLIALTNNIQIYQNNANSFNIVSSKGEYFSSGNSKDISMFGNCGCIRWPISSESPIITNYETLTQRVSIPVTNGKSDKIINIAIEFEHNGTLERQICKINLADKPSSQSLKHYISKSIDDFIVDYADNIDYNVSVVYNPYYKTLAEEYGVDLDNILVNFDSSVHEGEDIYYNIDRTNRTISRLTTQEVESVTKDLTALNAELNTLTQELKNNEVNNSKKIELELRHNNLVESVRDRYIKAIDSFVRKGTFESSETTRIINVARAYIEQENINGVKKLLAVHEELGAIQAAQMAIKANTDGSISSTPKGTRDEKAKYEGEGTWTPVDPICRPSIGTDQCEPTDKIRIGQARVGSAELVLLSNASDATIEYLYDIFANIDKRYNSKVSVNVEARTEAIRDINAKAEILLNILDSGITGFDKQLDANFFKYNKTKINTLETEIDNISVLTPQEITTKTARINTINNEIQAYNANPNAFIVKDKVKGKDVIRYSNDYFTSTDVITEIKVRLSSIFYNNINPIHELTMFAIDSNIDKGPVAINIVNNRPIPISVEAVKKVNNAKRKYAYYRDISDLSYRNIAKSNTNPFWVVLTSDSSNSENKKLTKITPFLKYDNNVVSTHTFENYEQMNLPGFICCVKKLDHNHNDKYYISGQDVYFKNIKDGVISLEECEDVSFHASSEFYIPSEYNLNCVALNDDLIINFRVYTKDIPTGEKDEDGNPITETVNYKNSIIAVNSLTCSSILTLPSMFYDYTKKYFYKVTRNNITNFQNTIRSSDANIDEQRKQIYKFTAEDYYNVPANRGSIVKLFVLGNDMFVHNQHALLKFVGTNNISGTEGEITLKEGDIFESGVVFILDSINGKYGISEKHHSMVTSQMYIFWDKVDNAVYAFDGKQPTINILRPVQKLINRYVPSDICFADDEQNNRFFINFTCNEGNICLSYNFNVNSFVSIHDLNYVKSFTSRNNTYFVFNKYNQSYTYVNKITLVELSKNIYDGVNNYRQCNTTSLITSDDESGLVSAQDNPVSVVDILVNTSYEKIKSIEYLNWICSEISSYSQNTNVIDLAEEVNNKYGGDYIRIYSDQTRTALIKLTDNNDQPIISNNYDITNENNFKYPRYNCGVWSFDYFRDIKNTNNYQPGYNRTPTGIDDGHGNLVYRDYTQDSSLIYGKYFVVRFIFKNRNFKLENITLNMTDYDKVK